jgi:hypothetical protein
MVPGMATIDDVAPMVMALREVTEGERRGTLTWFVGGESRVTRLIYR